MPVVPPRPPWRIVVAFAIMCLGCFMASLDVQIVSASTEGVGESLSASVNDMSWVKTSYLIGEIIVIPLAAWTSRVISTRWLLTSAAAGFTLASILCAVAWDIRSMIVFRALQGIFIGVTIPLTFTACLVLFDGRRKAVAASFASIATGLAPTLSSITGAWITDNWSWHWVFYINLVPGTVIAMLAPSLVRIDKPDLTLLKGADYLGMILMAVFLGCLGYVLEQGPRWEWLSDDTIKICTWVAVLAGGGFVIRSLTCARPIVDLRAFANRNYALGCWFAFLTGVGIYGLIYLTPLSPADIPDFIAWQTGGAILCAGPLQLVAIPIYGFLVRRVDLRLLLMIGLACFGLCTWLFIPMMNQWGWEKVAPEWAFRGIAIPFAIASGLPLGLGDLPPDRVKHASGLFALMRSLGGAIGIAGCATILNDRTNLYFLRIVEHLNFSNTALADWLHRMSTHYNKAAAVKKLWEAAHREAQVQAFADAYFAIAVCFVVSVLMVPLMRAVVTK